MTGVNDDLLNRSDLLVNATLNGIYQGVIVAALVAITVRLLPRTNAATRHAVWFFTLFLIVSIIPAHLFYDLRIRNAEGFNGGDDRVKVPAALDDEAAVWAFDAPTQTDNDQFLSLSGIVGDAAETQPAAIDATGVLLSINDSKPST